MSSTVFWLLALALVAGTLAWLVVPLLRRTAHRDAPGDETAAAAVYRDHRRQLDADFAARTITEAERDVAVAELTRRFADELALPAPEEPVASERPRWIASLVLVACIPVVAGVMYLSLGNPAAVSVPVASAPADPANDPQIVAMVDQLAKRLQANSDDGEGWALLGRSYRVLGRFDAAAMAYNEAARRLPPNAALLVDWAETIAQAQGRTLVGQPTELLNRAIELEPDNVKALALLGAAAMERNDRAQATALWTRLRNVLPPDSPQARQIDAALAQAAGAPPPASGGKSVEGRVDIDPKLAKDVAPGATVFIFARDPEGGRMPLAAMKLAASDLPRTFALNDDMAMNPAATISKAASVVIEARVSKSGDVKPQSGDLAGTSAPVVPGARDVRVTIDRVVP
jgi:cytochrome c-type biogenesis protein CcmH